MPGFLKRLGAPLAFAGLVLLATVTMVRDRGAETGRDLPWWEGALLEVAIPLQRALASPVDAVRDGWRHYVDLVDVHEDNARLRQRIAALEEENLQYREALVASGHLERIAAMRDEFETPMLPSEVVGLDVSPWFRSVLVDRGRAHGVLAGHPVITEQGVVGLVTRTSPHAAKTMLLLDRQSTIDAVVQRSRARGIVRGRGTDTLEFEFVVRGSDVQIGDTVITSGLGGVYPKGLRVGEVVSLEDPGGSLIQVASVRPAVDFGRLEQVFVMLRRGPTLDLLYGPNTPDESETLDEPDVLPASPPTETAGVDGAASAPDAPKS
jgi:rod shape-determining protein MreC